MEKPDTQPDSSRKTVEQITQEWQAIEAKRPGGGFDEALAPLRSALASDRVPAQEKHLIEVVLRTAESNKQYHAEMGVLIAQIAAQAEALAAERERANILAWNNDGHAEWMTEHHQDLLRELPNSETTALLGRMLARWQRTPGQRQYVALSEVQVDLQEHFSVIRGSLSSYLYVPQHLRALLDSPYNAQRDRDVADGLTTALLGAQS